MMESISISVVPLSPMSGALVNAIGVASADVKAELADTLISERIAVMMSASVVVPTQVPDFI